jgi:hypothetical protein
VNLIPWGSIENWEDFPKTEEELRAALDAALETMIFEERSEYLRLLEEAYGGQGGGNDVG